MFRPADRIPTSPASFFPARIRGLVRASNHKYSVCLVFEEERAAPAAKGDHDERPG